MKSNLPSRTAEHNALFRAIECARAPQLRIVNDGMAQYFLSAPFRLTALLSRISLCRALMCRYIDYRWPGSRTSLLARTRLIDDYVISALASGIHQFVLLGVGFDSRAYRIMNAARARFFEVDHPNTSAMKQIYVRRALGTLPVHVKYVSVDFRRDSTQQALEAAGFDPLGRSLFLWEGVSNYLTEESVKATLSFISGMAEGTQLIFTYVDEAVLRDPASFDGGSEVQRKFAKIGEPWTFGIRPVNAADFFREFGLSLDSDLSANEYRKLYYESVARIKGYEFYHVVTAHVPAKAGYLYTGQTARANCA